MKLSFLSLSVLALGGVANAQYFSAGWAPGQKVAAEATKTNYNPQETGTPQPPSDQNSGGFSLSSLFDINKLLTSGPAVALFDKAGINISERVANIEAANAQLWDDRVQLITDDNFNDLIVNEPLTPQEEKDRTWVIVVTITSAKSDGVSKLVDGMLDSAYNQTLIAGDLPNIKWGRINYMNVTYLTTKWGIWTAPYLLIVRDRGQSIRFYSPYKIRVSDTALIEFLKAEGWKSTPAWSSSFAPGGRNEYLVDYFARATTQIYAYTHVIPNWILVIASTMVGSLLIGLLHRKSGPPPAAAKNPVTAPSPVTSSTSSTSAPVPATVAAPTPTPTPAKASKSKKLQAASSTVLTTDSEQESGPGTAKRSSTRQRRSKK